MPPITRLEEPVAAPERTRASVLTNDTTLALPPIAQSPLWIEGKGRSTAPWRCLVLVPLAVAVKLMAALPLPVATRG